MVKKSYPSVEYAKEQGDHELLSNLGRLGGVRSGEKRRAAAQRRKQLEALERGNIAPPKKERKPSKKALVKAAEVARLAATALREAQSHALVEEILEEHYRKVVLHDANWNHMRNLAGVKQD